MTGTKECLHHWLYRAPYREGDNRITPEYCKYCWAEHNLIEEFNQSNIITSKYYTPITYPRGKRLKEEDTKMDMEKGAGTEKREEEQSTELIPEMDNGGGQEHSPENRPKSHGKGGNTRVMMKYYDENKQAILSDCDYMGKAAAALKWKIPSATMNGLLKRWKKEEEEKETQPAKKSGLQMLEEETIPKYPLASKTLKIKKGLNTWEISKYIESNASKILADIESGMLIKDICAKWDISRKSLENFRRRHGLSVGILKPELNIFDIVDQIFEEEDDINIAKARWNGVKSVMKVMANK